MAHAKFIRMAGMLAVSMSSVMSLRSRRCTTLLDDQTISKLSPEPGLQAQPKANLPEAFSVE